MKPFFSFSDFAQSPGPSPLIVAACAAIPVVYISLPAVRLCLLVLLCFILITSLVWFLAGVLKKPTKVLTSINPFYIRICFTGALGLIIGFACISRIEQCAPGLPLETVSSIKGKLLNDPRSFASGFGQTTEEERGMAVMQLSETGNLSGSVRSSARGRALVFFPAGTMPRLRDFGRGAELYIEGNFLPDDNADGRAAVDPRFRAASVHIIKKALAPERMRTGVRSAVLVRLKPKAWGGLAAALLLGTRENLEGTLAVSFRNAGLSHILALSGMHLAFISAMLAFVLKKPLGKKGSVIAGFVFIVLYVFLVGPEPSLVRAVIMYGLGSFLILTGTTRQTFALLSAAFLIQILWNPTSAYSISFVLSYLALGGILVLSNPVLVLLRGRLPSSLAMGISASAGAFLVTAPVVSAFFGVLRPVGLIAGLVAAPLSGIFMALSFLWLLLSKVPFIGVIIGTVLDKLLIAIQFFMQWSISLFARFPGLSLPFPAICIVTPLLIACLLVFADRHARYRNEFARFA
ncbi:MAG: ComEC/Rec2 family competence protein [Treponema sp.]|nr:ComEC/Rec2 family competence protein [Treponema sp.]